MAQAQGSVQRVDGLRGDELLCAVVNQIIEHPETWDQKQWHCGTTHCVGGWCQVMGGKRQNDASVRTDAAELLGISEADGDWLFSGARTLGEIYGYASDRNEGRAGFDRAGFDRAGFDRAGFDRDGFDRDGFDRDGFDRAGFDRAGFDRAGFDRDGFDRDGFDRDGFDRAGFDRAGKRVPLLVYRKPGGAS